MSKFFFLWGTKGKKTSFGAPNGKKNPLGDQRKQKLPFLKPLEDFFFLFVPQRKFFFPLVPQRKINCSWGGGPVYFFSFFFGNFFQHVKKLLKFWNFVKIKVAKFKLNHLG